jgi:hypothetical protein
MLLAMFISYCEDFVGIKPHWVLFYCCFNVLPQSDRKVADSLRIKAANKSLFFHIDLLSNVPNWAKKWFYVYDCSALAFSHKLPPPLLVAEKKEVLKPEQEEADELESDLQDYHRRRGVTSQACLVAFLLEMDPAPEGMCVPNV